LNVSSQGLAFDPTSSYLSLDSLNATVTGTIEASAPNALAAKALMLLLKAANPLTKIASAIDTIFGTSLAPNITMQGDYGGSISLQGKVQIGGPVSSPSLRLVSAHGSYMLAPKDLKVTLSALNGLLQVDLYSFDDDQDDHGSLVKMLTISNSF
jgi:hypothetical protein